MRPDLIVKNRKLNRLLGVAGVILSCVMFFLAFWNIGWLYRLVGLCAIIYYLVDIEQGLEESHAITRSVRIILIVIGVDKTLDDKKEITVDIPTDKPGTYNFACGMDMFHGKVVVK